MYSSSCLQRCCNRMQGQGREKQLASVYIGDKKHTGNWWHAFNIRISQHTEVSGGETRSLKKFEYSVIDQTYNGPAVCVRDCGVGGSDTTFVYRPTTQEMLKKAEWKIGADAVDPRDTTGLQGYRTLMVYEASKRKCEVTAYVEIRALDALTNSYLTDATFRIDALPQLHRTFDYRIFTGPYGRFLGGYVVKQGVHSVRVTRTGYIPQTFKMNVPAICEGTNCLPDDVIYREIYMVPNDGRTRAVLNWGDVPRDLDLLVMPVGVMGPSQQNVVWNNALGNAVSVYGYDDWTISTTNYGVGREAYASRNLVGDFRCACEYTCPELPSTHPFVCTHDPSDPRDQCHDYEATWDLWPSTELGQAPLCVVDASNGIVKAACCCNEPNDAGLVTCVDGFSDAWCCPKVEEIQSSLCKPGCSMKTDTSGMGFQTTISIDRDESGHNTQKPDTGIFHVNRPEVATMSNLLPGMYKVYANAYSPVLCDDVIDDKCDNATFGTKTEIAIYLGNGVDQTVMVDTISLNRGAGKWVYAGYIVVTDAHQSCLSPVKMLQKTAINGKFMCYTWFAAGYAVSNPLALNYGAIVIRIAGASGRDNVPLPDFTGVQYSIHAGGLCTCTVSNNGNTGCRCSGSTLVHAGILGPTRADGGTSEGWAITNTPLYFAVQSGYIYSIILMGGREYFDQLIILGEISPHPLGQPAPVRSAVMVGRVDDGELRVVFTWKTISDGDLYIFKDPIPGSYQSDEPGNSPFVFWDAREALPGIRLEQHCTTKECGAETIFFAGNFSRKSARYSDVI